VSNSLGGAWALFGPPSETHLLRLIELHLTLTFLGNRRIPVDVIMISVNKGLGPLEQFLALIDELFPLLVAAVFVRRQVPHALAGGGPGLDREYLSRYSVRIAPSVPVRGVSRLVDG
jgi:hypothetical protein